MSEGSKGMWPDWLKIPDLSPRVLFALGTICAAILFLPERWADALGFLYLREHYRPWVGLALVAFYVLWATHAIPAWARRGRRRATRREILNELQALTPPEALILAHCLYRGVRTVYLPINHTGAMALVNKGLLDMAHGTLSALAVPFTIPAFVWQHLQSNRPWLEPRDEGERQALEAFAAEQEHRQSLHWG